MAGSWDIIKWGRMLDLFYFALKLLEPADPEDPYKNRDGVNIQIWLISAVNSMNDY